MAANIINAKNSAFQFFFPKNVISKRVIEKYTPLVSKFKTQYGDVRDFINVTIKSVTIPSISGEVVEQNLFDTVAWRDGRDAQMAIGREFTVTCKLTEGYVNYFVMFETLIDYMSFNNNKEFLPDFVVRFMDSYGNGLLEFKYKEVIYTGISELDLSFSTDIPSGQEFTMDFRCNFIEFKTIGEHTGLANGRTRAFT